MGHIKIFFTILLISSAIAHILHYRFERAVPISAFLMIIGTYVLGLVGALSTSLYLMYLLGAIAIVINAFYIYKYKRKSLDLIFTPGFALFIICFFLVFWAHRGRMLGGWDEYSHWGLVVKNMFALDKFGTAPEATTMFKRYPPATALYKYLWCKLYGKYEEGILFQGLNFLSITLIFPAFQHCQWRRWKSLLLSFFALILVPVCFYDTAYTTLYVDPILGMLFAYVLFTYFSATLIDTALLLNLSGALCVLTLTKASGFGLAIIACGIILLDLFKNKILVSILQNKNGRTRAIFVALILLLVCVISNYSWELHSKGHAWNGMKNLTFSAAKDFIMLEGAAYQYETAINFIRYFFTQEITFHILKMTAFTWTVLILIIVVVAYNRMNEMTQRDRIAVAIQGLFAGWILYVVSLLTLYLFTYSEYEAVRLASCGRYLSTYLTGALVFITTMAVNRANLALGKENSGDCVTRQASILGAVLLIVNPLPILETTVLASANIKQTQEQYQPYVRIEEQMDLYGVDRQNAKVSFIAQNSQGLEYLMFSYALTPGFAFNGLGYSLGAPYYEGDVWTVEASLDEWLTALEQGATHVYLFRIDEQFKQLYAGAFEREDDIQEGALYEVVTVTGSVRLRLIGS